MEGDTGESVPAIPRVLGNPQLKWGAQQDSIWVGARGPSEAGCPPLLWELELGRNGGAGWG